MSDQGEKTCPLCAEEMDLTDQQLKPCKCGYEICVWCWHHIMDMAEKDDTEGRCPACRTSYDKEKIVGMAANCERLVAEINMEKKMKSHKAKTKTSEGRKQLTSVRVIQRNLVYIVGLPLNLADEDLLQRKDYFGQYGRVLKVSISRTAAGAIQHFPNNTCSVYITYSKEDEAVRCIQSVHGFTLDGRSLRACFGTTKYCHAWLRNVPCSNPDCLYLHEVGSQEDSFTKDEIISAYTRSRVQQITGASNNLQRRAGNILPSPVDEYCNNNSASNEKSIAKSVPNSLASIVKGSPPNGTSGRSAALPAAASWGMRSSNGHPPVTSSASLNGPSRQKPDTIGGSVPSSSAVTSATLASKLPIDLGKKHLVNEDTQTLQSKIKLEMESVRASNSSPIRTSGPESGITSVGPKAALIPSGHLSCLQVFPDHDRGTALLPNSNSLDQNGKVCTNDPEKLSDTANGKLQNICSVMSSVTIDRQPGGEHFFGSTKPSSLCSDHVLMKPLGPGAQDSQRDGAEQSRDALSTPADRKETLSASLLGVSSEQYDLRLNSKPQLGQSSSFEGQQNLRSFDNQRLNDSEVTDRASLPGSSHLLNYSKDHPLQPSNSNGFSVSPLIVNKKPCEGLPSHASDYSLVSNGNLENPAGLDKTGEHSHLLLNGGKTGQMVKSDVNLAHSCRTSASDMGESSIISNILSMDFDAWDDSLTSPQNFAKLLGETDQQSVSLSMSSSWKVQNSNQSRFSFARQEESMDLTFGQPSVNTGGMSKNQSFTQKFSGYKNPHSKVLSNGNASPSSSFEESDNLQSGNTAFSSNKLPVTRAQVSAPPGFSAPSRAPPPGFLSHDRTEPSFDNISGNRLVETSNLTRSSYQVPETVNMGSTGDIEFMDPAILAVGKGRLPSGLSNLGLDMRSNAPQHFSAFENEARLQLLMQRSLSQHQNLRFSDNGDNFTPLTDSYGIPSRLMEQSQTSNISPFSHVPLQQSRNSLTPNHWDGWNEIHNGNNLGMAELLRNERLGFNKYYTGYEDSKFRMPNSGDLYNRTFGM